MIFVLVVAGRSIKSVAENKDMRILVFLHGTIIMHRDAADKTREERVQQSFRRERSIFDYESYIPVGNSVEKLSEWQRQGADIIYLSSHKSEVDVERDKAVLKKYNFPEGEVLFRTGGELYKDIIEKIIPDVLIEDDCESIGGEKEMAITLVRPEIKQGIRSIVVKEFQGIDHLPDNVNLL